MIKKYLVLISMSLLWACAPVDQHEDPDQQDQRQTSVSRIDHILVRTDEVDQLFALFKQNFGLPEAWAVAAGTGYKSGGLFFGNTTVEFITFYDETENFIHGLAFEPLTTASASRSVFLQEGIICGAVVDQGYWSIVNIDGYFDSVGELFVCDYDWDNYSLQQQMRQTLISQGGGWIGLEAVQEVIIVSSNTNLVIAQWDTLLYPVQNTNLTWTNYYGPSVTVIPGSITKLERLVLRVSSLTHATNVLSTNQMLIESNGMFFITNTNITELIFQVIE